VDYNSVADNTGLISFV